MMRLAVIGLSALLLTGCSRAAIAAREGTLLGFVVVLCIAGMAAPFVFSFVVVPLFGLSAITTRGGKPTLFTYLVLALLVAAQAYFWGLWGTFCSWLAAGYAASPHAWPAWIYYLLAFGGCTMPIAFLSGKELATAQSGPEVRGIQNGTMLYHAIAILAYVGFSIWPSAAAPVYGWVLAVDRDQRSGMDATRLAADRDQRSGTDATRLVEYTDNEYSYEFQYPADWALQKPPPQGQDREVRVLVRSPRGDTYMLTTVGRVGSKPLSKEHVEANPNRDAAVNAMIELTLDQIYKKTSQQIGASSMTVHEKRAVPSEEGLVFYIATEHVVNTSTKKLTMGVAGLHVIPFGKDYLINFVMIAPIDPNATAENELLKRIFNSFRLRR